MDRLTELGHARDQLLHQAKDDSTPPSSPSPTTKRRQKRLSKSLPRTGQPLEGEPVPIVESSTNSFPRRKGSLYPSSPPRSLQALPSNSSNKSSEFEAPPFKKAASDTLVLSLSAGNLSLKNRSAVCCPPLLWVLWVLWLLSFLTWLAI